MRAAFASALALASACTIQARPVRPTISPLLCGDPAFVGQPMRQSIAWSCEPGEYGRTGDTKDAHCQRVVELTARCVGVDCVTSVHTPPTEKWRGAREIEIVPQTPGPLQLEIAVQPVGGPPQRSLTPACEVLPAPDLTLTCLVRDPTSGSFVPCPTPVPAGWEIHLQATAQISTGSRVPMPEVALDGVGLSRYKSYRPEPAECLEVKSDDPRTATVRCTTVAPGGAHRFTAQVGHLPEHTLGFVIAGTGPGGR